MRLVVQQNAKTCGQACVAMILDITHDEACGLVGHRSYTTTRDLVAALRKGGAECDDRLCILRDRPWWHCNTCILRRPDRRSRHKWHWLVYHDGFLYDPAFPPGPTSIYSDTAIDWDRYSSFLRVWGRGGLL